MKKVLITMAVLTGMVAGGMVFSSFAAPRQNKSTEITMAVPTDGPGTCVQVGNCTVSISRDYDGKTYTVTAKNHNRYTVTVNWSAYCNKTKVGGGTLTLGTTGYVGDTDSATVYSSQEGVYLDDVSVYKCD